MTESEQLIKRFSELSKKSESAGYFIFTDFLGLAEQSAFSVAVKELGGVSYTAFGGAEGAERVMIRFGSPEELGYEEPFPIGIIKSSPRSEKYADKLTHRDFLGALLNLGIERDTLGDIVIKNNVAYIFVKAGLCEYVCGALTKVKHTDVRCEEVSELPEGELYTTKAIRIQASSERVDGIIAKVFSLSRDEASQLQKRGLIFINGKCADSPSKQLKPGDKITARGHGRFIYLGYESLSKKGKLNINIELYV